MQVIENMQLIPCTLQIIMSALLVLIAVILNAACTNTPPGSFTCTCNQGFTGNGVICMGK